MAFRAPPCRFLIHCRTLGLHRFPVLLSDFGPTYLDASTMPPFFTRGILLDAAGHRGIGCLPKGSPIDADELQAIADALARSAWTAPQRATD